MENYIQTHIDSLPEHYYLEFANPAIKSSATEFQAEHKQCVIYENDGFVHLESHIQIILNKPLFEDYESYQYAYNTLDLLYLKHWKKPTGIYSNRTRETLSENHLVLTGRIVLLIKLNCSKNPQHAAAQVA